MSVTSSVEESIKPNGVDTYDSGDDWEIGVGNLIIDLDADLEKDRQKLEMNRILSIKSTVKGCDDLAYNCANATAVLDGLTCPSVQPCVARGNVSKDSKKFRLKKRNSSNDSDKFPSLDTLCGIPKVCISKRREAQGRPREAFEMNSAPDQMNSNPDTSDVTVSCAKGKEGKKGKNQSKGLKREKDSVRTRKDKQSDGPTSFEFGPASENGCAFGGKENPCYCGDNGMGDINRGGMDAGMRGSAIVVEKTDETSTPDHIQKTLNIKTRSIGTNTQEAERATDSGFMEPCQPGTSVNLEAIVWHETEEGVLVVNVTWRKRTYVGTLLDCTKHDWAPPRFCESPSSDSEMPGGGRGRGKRMRLTIPDQPLVEPGLSKVRGLSYKRRGVGIGNKGRRGSLNLSNCRTNPFYSVEDIKSSPLICGKRKTKVPAELDLSLVTEDIKNGNGKRIRAKSRSAPSTPQGKSDPVFMDQVCASPMLIDCPHPNCNKKYKHINGLRYHQSHAHLESDNKPEFEAESEDRLSDYEEPITNMTFDCTEMSSSVSKKAKPVFKLNSLGSSKGRKVSLSNDHGPTVNTKTRRTMVNKEGAIDDLSNLPLISNMSVVLENCLITDRNSSVEMPKLEAEGAIDKRDICEKVKKENAVADRCSSKSRTNRLITSPPAPPKLIAIPTTPFSPTPEGTSNQSPPTVNLTKAKNLSLKPIKPKLDIIAQVNVANAAFVTSKESKRKERHRLKDRNGKETRSPKTDPTYIRADDGKSIGKDFPVSLLKEHLSKQDTINGPSETQESRMASIRAEADKVYTFTDNAPSPSIGSSARIDPGTLANGDGTKTNSPAYSDISDVAEDGGSNTRSRTNLASDSSTSINAKMSSSGTPIMTVPVKESQSTSLSHGYEPHGLQNYMHAGQPNTTTFLKISTGYGRAKEDIKEVHEDMKSTEPSSESSSQSQLQLAMTQTQTALAQSLYYGQYTRSISMDQKVVMVPNTHRQSSEMCCDDVQYNKQRSGQARREPEQRERSKDEPKMIISSGVISKGTNSIKVSCTKPSLIYVELNKQLPIQQPQGKSTFIAMTKDQGLDKESEDFKTDDPNQKTNVDSNPALLKDSDTQSWNCSYQSKYTKQQNQDMSKISEELSSDKSKDWQMSPEHGSRLEAELQNAKHQDSPSEDSHSERTRADEEETPGEVSEDSQSARVAVSSPLSPQQSYIQYQHSYPYLHLCDTSNSAYRVMSPALAHNYPGFHYPLYGKTAGREESDMAQNNCGLNKTVSDSTALELLQRNNMPYHGKSPVPGERGSPDQERETEREKESVPFARHLHTHHHTHLGIGYTLVSGQYDPFQGLNSAALVTSQQVSTAQNSSNENDGKM
ncbi:zinc finger protein 608 [Chanos chanos]|uniref:Zinc finger protein 608 n=1 Tax=Chanos chanos TaxID=29144 RepID=A0A6J2WIZ0_CHACN|nr:zinc finger protein 608 [Chanos chanos]